MLRASADLPQQDPIAMTCVPLPLVMAILVLLLPAAVPAAACRGDETAAMTIRWDESTRTLVQAGAGYGRMIRLREGAILCAYSVRGVVFVRKSLDAGRTWQPSVRVADFAFGRATNAELLQRADGAVLFLFNQRPTDRVHAYAIAMATSQDDGVTWSKPRVLYRAGTTRRTGCWEPAAAQLPSGEIQLFFANESPYPESEEQEITMLRPADGGRSWQPPRRVAFRPGHRDGMPVPLVLGDGRGIVLAIEDNGLHGRFKPAIVHTPLDRSWSHASIGADSPNRWGALAEPLPEAIYAGAPYIRQFPSGETVLSVQSGEGRPRSGVHDNTQMVVYVGSAEARNFRNESVPFGVAPEDSGLWNSLFIKDARTVTAISWKPGKRLRARRIATSTKAIHEAHCCSNPDVVAESFDFIQ